MEQCDQLGEPVWAVSCCRARDGHARHSPPRRGRQSRCWGLQDLQLLLACQRRAAAGLPAHISGNRELKKAGVINGQRAGTANMSVRLIAGVLAGETKQMLGHPCQPLTRPLRFAGMVLFLRRSVWGLARPARKPRPRTECPRSVDCAHGRKATLSTDATTWRRTRIHAPRTIRATSGLLWRSDRRNT